MKRTLFYILFLFQITVVLVIVLQYNLIDKYGEERTFITQPFEDEYYEGENYIQNYDTYTFEFEINNIPKDKWEGNDYDYRAQVYVLLKENKTGVYEVVKATDKKITTDKATEVVLIGHDIYESEDKVLHVNYGFDKINVKNHESLFKDYELSKPRKATYKFAPWNQSKLVNIE